MALGPVMLDLEGTELTALERERLAHPATGGVILFTRNYESPEQIAQLIGEIHAVRTPRLLVAVDHEGGSIQRFRAGFTHLPAPSAIGEIYDQDAGKALTLSEETGWLMAVELRVVGVDFSFAPVLDIRTGMSRVVNDRSFHRDPETVAGLAAAFVRGMHAAGMAAVGKHFPGHGSVSADSHHETPIDERDLEDIRLFDLIPFERLIHRGIAAVMPAHVVYPRVDSQPAGFSRVWLTEILRRELGFQGVIFSDDICMAGAEIVGSAVDRARAALSAGCDAVMVCNSPESADAVLDDLGEFRQPLAQVRLMRMHGRGQYSRDRLINEQRWRQVSDALAALDVSPELDLGDNNLG